MTQTDDPVMEAVLQAADRLRGDGGWSMARLAKEAGVSRATLYRRFQSRGAVEQALREAGVGVTPRTPRERCLDAVGALAVTAGLPAMTIAAVADEAQVGVATVYRLFENRSGLLRAFTVERGPRARLELAMLDEGAPLVATLQALVAALLAQVHDHAPWLGLAMSGDDESRALVAELVAVERAGRARLTQFMERRVARGELSGEPRLLAQALLSLAAGRALFSRVDGERPTAEDARAVVRLFLHGTVRSPQ
jgi:AcrR family transcriptional regulator